MNTRRHFLATTTLAGAHLIAGENETSDSFSFGLMADCQYVDAPNKGKRHFRKSPSKLSEAVEHFNKAPLDFSLHLGDFIDRDIRSFDPLNQIVKSLKKPLHHLLGNHDFKVAKEDKSSVPKRLGLTKSYYSFLKKGCRFIILDTTSLSTYRYPKGSKEHQAATAEFERLTAQNKPNARPWNSGVDPVQMKWLESELKDAQAKKQRVIVGGHHVIVPYLGLSAWNSAELQKLFTTYGVKVYLNGHNHAGSYNFEEGVHYLNLHGMVDTEKNSFALATLHPDRLVVQGFGRQKSHELKL